MNILMFIEEELEPGPQPHLVPRNPRGNMGRFGLPDDWNDRHDRFIARAEALDIERETIVKLVKERYPILRYTVITLDMLDRRIQALDQSGNDYFRAGSIQRCAELKAKFKAKRREKEQAEERELMAKHKAYKDAQKKEDEEEAGQETEQVAVDGDTTAKA